VAVKINSSFSLHSFVFTFFMGLFYPTSLLAADYNGSLIDAVRITLERQSSIAISRQQAMVSEGQVLSAQGNFDPILNAGVSFEHNNTPLANLNISTPISEIRSNSTRYQTGLTQKLRSGVIVNSAVTVTHTRDNYENTLSPSNANVALNFTLPLQKGRGRDVATAYEKAAMLNREAAIQSQRHAVSASITRTVVAYWDFFAAKQVLDIALTAEDRAKNLLSDAKKLATGDELPLAEVKRYETKLLNEIVNRIGTEQALVEARSNLGLAMGLNGRDIALITIPNDSFYAIDTSVLATENLNDMALKLAAMVQVLRSDIIAVDNRLDSAQVLLLAAADTQKPQLDLVLGVGYSGLTNNRQDTAALTSLVNNIDGANASIGVNYKLPVNNRAAQGIVQQRLAEIERIRLEKQALLDNVFSSIEVRLSGFNAAARQLKQAEYQVEIQRDVFANEKKKYGYGLTTLLDLFTSETQLTSAQLSEVNARRNLAQALIRVRFETGTLLDGATESQVVDNARLVTLPRLAKASELVR
jgi:outer membrane protein TolC